MQSGLCADGRGEAAGGNIDYLGNLSTMAMTHREKRETKLVVAHETTLNGVRSSSKRWCRRSSQKATGGGQPMVC